MPLNEIDLRADLLARHRSVFNALRVLSIQLPVEQWCVVGGLMVLIRGRSFGRAAPRASTTKDADVLVDVVTYPAQLATADHILRQLGFVLADQIGSGLPTARCTYLFGASQIDLLCPDTSPEDALDIGEGLKSLAIPGGARALELSELVEIFYDDDAPNAVIRVPTIHGALVAKAAAAIDLRTNGQMRHIQDVAFLLTLVTDPRSLFSDFTSNDCALLHQLTAPLADDTHVAWDGISRADRAQARAALSFV